LGSIGIWIKSLMCHVITI